MSETKRCHVTFTVKRQNCAKVLVNDEIVPQLNFFGMHPDRRLKWRELSKQKHSKWSSKNKCSHLSKNSKLGLEFNWQCEVKNFNSRVQRAHLISSCYRELSPGCFEWCRCTLVYEKRKHKQRTKNFNRRRDPIPNNEIWRQGIFRP